MVRIDVSCHYLVPRHSILPKDEVDEILKKYNIRLNQLPKIHRKDPAANIIGAKLGDIIKIERESETAGISVAYRLVIDKETLL